MSDDGHAASQLGSACSLVTSGLADLSSTTSLNNSPFEDHEEIESTEKLVLRLLKEDHDEFLQRRKGKERVGDVSDSGLSLTIWKNEVYNADQTLEDRMMALSINNAVASDQHIIAALQEEELAAQRDRDLALRLSGRTGVAAASKVDFASRANGSDPTIESLCEVISSLGKQSISVRRPDTADTEPSSSRIHGPGIDNCVFCLNVIKETPIFGPACKHIWCNDCMRNAFLKATRDEELYPPRCCKNVFPPSLAMRLLEFSELSTFCAAGVEFATEGRVYCADTMCSAFIPPWMIRDERGECPRCHKPTHTACKASGEPSHTCPTDNSLQQALVLAAEEGWKQCVKCGSLVEMTHGCNHMTCLCGGQFCYECGKRWKTCKCPRFTEHRLIDMAHRAVNNEIGRNADAAQRAVVLERAVRRLRDHANNDCQHHLRTQWRYTTRPDPLQCEVCHHTLPEYIFVCKSCQMLACQRCKMTRLR